MFLLLPWIPEIAGSSEPYTDNDKASVKDLQQPEMYPKRDAN